MGKGRELVFRPSIFNHALLLVAILVAVLIAIYISIYIPITVQTVDIGFLLPIPGGAIIPLILLARLFHHEMNQKLILCDDHVVYVEGLVSWREHSVRIDYEDIQEIEIDQTLLQKIFGVGDLVLLSLASTGNTDRIEMKGISRPATVKDLIQKFADQKPGLAA